MCKTTCQGLGRIGLCAVSVAVLVACSHRSDGAARMNAGPMVCAELRCESGLDPLGVDSERPRLSWVLRSAQRGQQQTAYQIQVAGDRGRLLRGAADLWDSGRVASSRSIQVEYGGAALAPRQRCFWRVRVWDGEGHPSAWSAPAEWEMGLLSDEQWSARWIGDGRPLPASDAEFYADDPAPLLRKSFAVKGPIRRARLYITGLGYYDATINGKRLGERVLDPIWTDYTKRVFYSVFDVKEHLQSGANALGVMLGNGWYNPLPLRMWGRINLREHLPVGRPRLRAQLEIDYADGSREVVSSDESWRVAEGPLRRNSIYLGEVYDARRERPGWDRPGFDDADWDPAKVVEGPGGRMRATPLPPIRPIGAIKPVKRTQPTPGVYVIDFGRNFTGLVRMRVRGPAGTRVKLRYGELLHDDGTVNVMTGVCGQIKRAGVGGPGAPDVAEQADGYILRGDGEEQYMPRFTFHGFRYVEIHGYPGEPALEDFVGLPLACDLEPVGRFACSNDLFNDIEQMVRRTFLANVMGVQSDCPHRERFGYGGDIVATAEAYLLHYDMATFYAKTVVDFSDAVRSNGGLTETAPHTGISAGGFGERSGPIGWGLAHPLLLRELYRYYGDRRLIEGHYEVARGWVELIRRQAPEHVVRRGIGDHEAIVRTPNGITGTAFYYHTVTLVSEMAAILGREREAAEYRQLAQDIRRRFMEEFVKGSGRLEPETQTAYALALYHGLAPREQTEAFVATLAARVRENDQRLTTGIFGTKYLLDMLSQHGQAPLAYRLVDHKDWPGWGFMLESGATTLWEHWKFSDNTFSHSHPMFGSVSEWLMRHVAGISAAPEAVGFDQIIIHPKLVGELTWARGEYDSVRGKVACHWELDGGELQMHVRVPVGAVAKVFVATSDAAAVQESGRPAAAAPGCRPLPAEDGKAVYLVESGEYRFTAPFAAGAAD